ncbi:DivIVA domain-containing protein [Spirillospora sp. NBC_00431]
MQAGFATTRPAAGYSVEQVDAFLDRVAEEIAVPASSVTRLARERDALR